MGMATRLRQILNEFVCDEVVYQEVYEVVDECTHVSLNISKVDINEAFDDELYSFYEKHKYEKRVFDPKRAKKRVSTSKKENVHKKKKKIASKVKCKDGRSVTIEMKITSK